MKKRLYFILSIIVIVSFTLMSSHIKRKDNSVLCLANVEALAENNESSTGLTCLGIFGWCSFTCTKCGVGWNALGSTMLGKHTCSSTK